ncbi:hypothetical protein BGV71_11495 [Burkholderia ubonensis]|uniref:hypothetical protein n=1 Tax=Burkholderia ubonensis TaxID=101571 RepID=UPI0007522BA2|nr:hypothetical protein [Burkholderia ubonensis]KVC81145.1 hypothetical protein WI76_11055 [Burkholderia ubonensis]KVZ34836.1 hypothetical protein WL13_24335 [Burkholderia ubonensis]KWB22459.1 hypothetical protein WL33_02200 [Burkholderia ubonensis]KWC29517.1 hypothetical protein WL50_29280 [Burkholderia ubonensis]OJA84974.1 hypothetical protein BGV71_11495 [Burkholderia ubonensis]
MKFWGKLVACFLIAWLPMLGYPAQAALCPEMTSMMPAVQHPMKAASAIETTGCTSGTMHVGTSAHPSACHAGMGSTVCGMLAIPMSHRVGIVLSTPDYRTITPFLAEQFIPELPAPPPRSL